MPYEEFDAPSYTALRRGLLDKQSARPRAFLDALRTSAGFGQWMRNEIRMTPGERLPLLKERLTESEFTKPPCSTERRLFSLWRALEPADACRTTLWARLTLRHIEQESIEAAHLAANDSPRVGGRERIERALKAGEGEVDSVVRTALRRLGGLPEARGNRSVYVDCPFARAWWRGHLAAEAVRETRDRTGERDVLQVFRQSQQYWEDLMMFVVSKNSVLGDASVRTAMVWALADMRRESPRNAVFTSQGLKSVLRRIGIRSAWQELGVLPVDALRELMEHEFLPSPTDGRTDGTRSSAHGLLSPRQREVAKRLRIRPDASTQ